MQKSQTDLRHECGHRFARFQFLIISYIEANTFVMKNAEQGRWEEIPPALLIIYLIIIRKIITTLGDIVFMYAYLWYPYFSTQSDRFADVNPTDLLFASLPVILSFFKDTVEHSNLRDNILYCRNQFFRWILTKSLHNCSYISMYFI